MHVIQGFCHPPPTITSLLGNAWRAATCHHDTHPRSFLLHQYAASAYQGWVLAFIGDRQVTKEPNPVSLPTTKTWEWHLGNAITEFEACDDYFTVKTNQGTLWTPDASNGVPGAIPVPHLLAIPNVLVNLLCMQEPAIMPHNVLFTVHDFILSSLHPLGLQWDCV